MVVLYAVHLLFRASFAFVCLSSLRQHVAPNNRDCELRGFFDRSECCSRNMSARIANWEIF